MAGPRLCPRSIACTKRWYDTASLVKRRPLASTASEPGLPRSVTVWGYVITSPSARRYTDAGVQYALSVLRSSTTPPAPVPRRSPSPVLPGANGLNALTSGGR